MIFYSPDFINFFKELSANNNTEWFDTNRKRYEKEVKNPFKKFVDEMIKRIQQIDPEVNISSADAIFRINKDIRFSKDKTPYNTHVSANISPFGRKNKEYPGFYFQLGADKIMIVGGAYMVEKDALLQIRSEIVNNPNEFESIINDKNFKEKFNSIQGEKNKKLSAELQEFVKNQPLIANKQFYYSAEIDASKITQPDLADILMDYYLAGKKVNDFLKKAIKVFSEA